MIDKANYDTRRTVLVKKAAIIVESLLIRDLRECILSPAEFNAINQILFHLQVTGYHENDDSF